MIIEEIFVPKKNGKQILYLPRNIKILSVSIKNNSIYLNCIAPKIKDNISEFEIFILLNRTFLYSLTEDQYIGTIDIHGLIHIFGRWSENESENMSGDNYGR